MQAKEASGVSGGSTLILSAYLELDPMGEECLEGKCARCNLVSTI